MDGSLDPLHVRGCQDDGRTDQKDRQTPTHPGAEFGLDGDVLGVGFDGEEI